MADSLPIAVRVYPDLKPTQPERKSPQIDGMLVFDCESRVDKIQSLTFGSYRFLVDGRCLEEGLFYADDLTARELKVLEEYARSHPTDTDPRGIPERNIPSNPELMLLPAADFRKLLYHVAYKGRGLLVAFNFPFDISKIAIDYVPSRDRFLGGFTPSSGALTPISGSPFAAGVGPRAIAIDPSGKFAYVTDIGHPGHGRRKSPSTLSAYSINASTGALTQVSGSPFAFGPGPSGIAIDPLGECVYVTASSGVYAYAIDATTGALSPVSGSPFAAGSGPDGIATCEVVGGTCVPPPP